MLFSDKPDAQAKVALPLACASGSSRSAEWGGELPRRAGRAKRTNSRKVTTKKKAGRRAISSACRLVSFDLRDQLFATRRRRYATRPAIPSPANAIVPGSGTGVATMSVAVAPDARMVAVSSGALPKAKFV